MNQNKNFKMKKQFILAATAVGLMLSSCVNTPKPKTLEELASADLNDTIGYYWGQQLSNRYWHMAKQDSLLKNESGKKSYLEGFQAVMELVKSDDNAYNMGMYSAIEAMLGMMQANKDYLMNIDKDNMLSGLAYGMQTDSIVDYVVVQNEMEKIFMRLQKEKTLRDKEKADSLISKKMKSEGYDRDLKGNVYKETTKGDGAKIESNDQLLVEISFSTLDGVPLFPSTGATKFIVDQNQFPPIVNESIKEMNVGSTRQFMVAATDLFGGNIPRHLNINSTDAVLYVVKVVGYCDDKGEPSDVAIKATPVGTKQLPLQPVTTRK